MVKNASVRLHSFIFMTSRMGLVEVLVTICTILDGLRDYDSNDEAKVDGCGVHGIKKGRCCVFVF